MKDFKNLQRFSEYVMNICAELYDTDVFDVSIDMNVGDNGISISVNIEPDVEDDDDDFEVTEEELDKACEEHYDCCDCPYEDYCNGEGEDE